MSHSGHPLHSQHFRPLSLSIACRLAAAALVVGLATFAASVPTQAAVAANDVVVNCNNSGPGSLRQVVADASSGGTIIFALSPKCSTIDDSTGPIFIGANLTIDGPGPSILALNGENDSGLFQITSGATVSISGLTIEDGSANQGAGIWNEGGTVSILDSDLLSDSARGDGGAIYSSGGTVNVRYTTLSTDSASGDGGAIYSSGGAVNVTYAALSTDTAGSDGGAIYSSAFGGTVNVEGSTLSTNSAGNDGGGISINDATLAVVDSSISSNTTVGEDGGGGGMFLVGELTMTDSTLSGNRTDYDEGGGILNLGSATISDSTLSGNSSGGPYWHYFYGGGIYNAGTLTMTNSTLAANSTNPGYGGAILEGAGSAAISSSTLAGNTARHGAGIDVLSGTVTLEATIVANNKGADCVGSITDDGYNIDDDGTCGFTLPSISDYITLSRTLGPLAENGGPTETIALLPGSPAIDYVSAADCPATDQRGATRYPPCDIGAYDTDGSYPTITRFIPTKGKVGSTVVMRMSRPAWNLVTVPSS